MLSNTRQDYEPFDIIFKDQSGFIHLQIKLYNNEMIIIKQSENYNSVRVWNIQINSVI